MRSRWAVARGDEHEWRTLRVGRDHAETRAICDIVRRRWLCPSKGGRIPTQLHVQVGGVVLNESLADEALDRELLEEVRLAADEIDQGFLAHGVLADWFAWRNGVESERTK